MMWRVLLLLLVYMPIVTAEVTELQIVPQGPVRGDVVTVRGKSTEETVTSSISYKKRVGVAGGKYEYVIEDVYIPSGSVFEVVAENVENMKLGIRYFIWWERTIEAVGGVARKSTDKVPEGTHDFRIRGDALSGSNEVLLRVKASRSLDVDLDGNFEFSYDTSSLPIGDFQINVDGVTRTITLLGSRGGSPPAGRGGGGGGGGKSQEETLSHTVSKISPLSPASFTFLPDRSPVFEVSITARELCYYVKVTVETLEEKPNDMPDPGGETYRYLRVEKEGIQDRAIEKAEIKFRVEKSWLTENNIDKVFLNKNVGGGWEELPTRELMEDDAHFYYSAATSGFSYFAIIGRRVPEPSTPQPVSTESPSIETQPETPQPMETPKPIETTAPRNSKTLPPAIPAPNPSPTETSLMEKIAPRFRVITPLLALILAYLLIRRREKSN